MCCCQRSLNMCMTVTVFQNVHQFFYFVSLLLQRVVVPLFILADMLLCCQIWNLFNLISGSSLNPIQVDLEPKSGEGLSTYEDIGVCEFSSMLKLFKLPIFPKLLSEVKDTRIQVFHKLLRLQSLALRGVQNLTSWGLYPKPPAYHNLLFVLSAGNCVTCETYNDLGMENFYLMQCVWSTNHMNMLTEFPVCLSISVQGCNLWLVFKLSEFLLSLWD